MPGQRKVLTEQEGIFCLSYHQSGDGGAAVISAGYKCATMPNAKRQARRLLKTLRVQREIKRLANGGPVTRQATQVRGIITIAEAAASRGTDLTLTHDASALYTEADNEKAAGLTRSHAVAALIEILEITMGRRPSKHTMLIRQQGKGTDGLPKPPVLYVYEVIGFDPANAIKAAEALLVEATMRENAGLTPEATSAAATQVEKALDFMRNVRRAS